MFLQKTKLLSSEVGSVSIKGMLKVSVKLQCSLGTLGDKCRYLCHTEDIGKSSQIMYVSVLGMACAEISVKVAEWKKSVGNNHLAIIYKM